MENWQEEILQALLESEDVPEVEVYQRIQNAVEHLGFEYYAYHMLRLPLPISRAKMVVRSSYPLNWQRLYDSQDLLPIDPVVLRGRQSTEPFVWSDELYQAAPDFREEALAHGLVHGWSKSSRTAMGMPSMLSFARSHDPITEAELLAKQRQMKWLANSVHLMLTNALITKFNEETAPKLTPREIQILRWTADGKSSEDVAQILKISVNTIHFHVKNIVVKLNASNKTSAVVRALMLGLLY